MKDIGTTTATSATTQKWIVCRVCLQQPKEAMACIFNDDASKDLTNMILECGGVPIKKFDHYPDKICDKCLKCLHIANKFRRNCQRSYKHLSQFIAPVVVEQSPVTLEDSTVLKYLEDESPESTDGVEMVHLSEGTELNDVIEQEILVDLDKDMIVHVKTEDDGLTDSQELYHVYETYADTVDELGDQTACYEEEITEQSLSGLSADIEYLDKVDTDQLTESAQEDELDVKCILSDEDFVPASANQSSQSTRSTSASGTTAKRRTTSRIVASKAAKGGAKRTVTSIIVNSDEAITIGDTIVRKATGIKTRGGRKVLVGDKKEYKFICDICGNMYPSQSRLTEHIKIHSGIKPHECEICGHAFAQAQQLSRHMNTHTGNRPYKCNYCPAAFADLSTRNKHHRIHTNERPYECDVCHKTFTYTNTLKFHKMIHTGEKPHVCDICGKGFPQAYKLRNHKVTHDRRSLREPVDPMLMYDVMTSAELDM